MNKIKIKIWDDRKPIFKEEGDEKVVVKSLNKFMRGKYR